MRNRNIKVENTNIIEINVDEARIFIEKNHSAGWAKSGKNVHCYALKTDSNEIVAVRLQAM